MCKICSPNLFIIGLEITPEKRPSRNSCCPGQKREITFLLSAGPTCMSIKQHLLHQESTLLGNRLFPLLLAQKQAQRKGPVEIHVV